MFYWKKLTQDERKSRIETALTENVNFATDASLGYPASKLDERVFYNDAPFLKDAPILQTYVANPNHIGCHTLGTSEKAFKGTQDIENEVLNVIACDIFKAEPNQFDGYISPGGTEANIQAMWMYRNFFITQFRAQLHEIAVIASEDTHYSIAKGSNLLQIDWIKVPVNFNTREIESNKLEQQLVDAKHNGKKYFIAIANMGTTMFGSVDNPDIYTIIFEKLNLAYKLHIDGAYGGFVYPFSNQKSEINFSNPKISSVTIDAHKMLQAPYGTGIFICRKHLIENVLTQEAEYVEGMDLTLCGSRSGANAVAVWMILFTYGPHGWFEKVSILQMRTEYLCKELDKLNVEYYRNPYMNIVTVDAKYINKTIEKKYDLIPQKHNDNNQWYKIVLMEHVEIERINAFVEDLRTSLKQ